MKNKKPWVSQCIHNSNNSKIMHIIQYCLSTSPSIYYTNNKQSHSAHKNLSYNKYGICISGCVSIRFRCIHIKSYTHRYWNAEDESHWSFSISIKATITASNADTHEYMQWNICLHLYKYLLQFMHDIPMLSKRK